MNKRDLSAATMLAQSAFEYQLLVKMHLQQVPGPLFLDPTSGLNDDLNSTEQPVTFTPPAVGKEYQIVHSLAKWKRAFLSDLSFDQGDGIFVRMQAIRQDEVPDATHSILVDQWDWERILKDGQRTQEHLKEVVRTLYTCIQEAKREMVRRYPFLTYDLPSNITFITTQELEDLYPSLKPGHREDAICKEKGAVCILGIGWPLESGAAHDGRASDYDDWHLNADILVWHRPLGQALELSSMGIRVDPAALRAQYEHRGREVPTTPYHKGILNSLYPLTIGGGIGRSRMSMYLLEQKHISKVQG